MTERKPIDEALRRYLDGLAAAGAAAPSSDLELAHLRRGLMMRALENRGPIPGLPNSVETRDVLLADGLSGRVYTPQGVSLPPVLVYLHGGGWIAGSIATHDPFCRLLSGAAAVMIVSVEYRLAPENPYPAAVEDAEAAVRAVAAHAAEWGGDALRLAVGGDSAGANLAAVVANRLGSQGAKPALRALLLLYPVIDHPSAGHASWTENATGYGLEASLMRWMWEQYGPGISPDDPGASPLRLKHLPSLPPTLVTTAEYDVLRDEGLAYVEKLRSAGVAVTHLHSPDMHHNFPVHPGTVGRFPQCDATMAEIAGWLRGALSGGIENRVAG